MSASIGVSTRRTDGLAKATGEAIYTSDYSEAGMLHAGLLRSPVPAGRIRKLDTAAAQAIPGVRAVVTAKDVPDVRVGLMIRDKPLFAREQVRYAGEPVAAVAADTPALVDAALAAIELEIEETEAVGDIAAAIKEGAPLVHPELSAYETGMWAPGLQLHGGSNVANEIILDAEGFDEVFATAYKVIEDSFQTGRQYHAYMEPKAAVASYRAGRYTIYAGNQWPFGIRDEVAELLGVATSDVRLLMQAVGGGFGAKLEQGLEAFAALLSRAANGRTVRLLNSRPEDMATANARENADLRIRSAVDERGNVLAREFIVHHDLGAYATETVISPSVSIMLVGGVYRMGLCRVLARGVYTNTPPTGCYRGVPGPYLYYAVEQHTDHIARSLGIDRRQYRIEQLVDNGHVMPNGQRLHDAGILGEAFAEVEKKAPWLKSQSHKKPWRGVGIGAAWWLNNTLPGTASVRVKEDGSVQLITAANENGSGAVAMALSQIVADELGVDVTRVVVPQVDTDSCGFDGGSMGSRTTPMTGRAVRDAVVETRKKVEEVAAGMLEAAVEDIELVEGQAGVIGSPQTRIPLGSIAVAASYQGLDLSGHGSFAGPPPDLEKPQGCVAGMIAPGMTVPNYHVHQAEVEVDPVTGKVSVLRYIVAQEVGKAINPAGIQGQIQGAVTQGIGYLLYESMRVEDARHLETSFEAYRLPLALDTPRVETIMLEHPWEQGPHGARGVAEPAILLPAAVIANAVADAIGRDRPFTKLPLTPEDVLAAIIDEENKNNADFS